MPNRFQSTVNGIAASFLDELQALPRGTGDGFWSIDEGQLNAQIDGQAFIFVFEKGDPLSEIVVSFLNHLQYLSSAARSPT